MALHPATNTIELSLQLSHGRISTIYEVNKTVIDYYKWYNIIYVNNQNSKQKPNLRIPP